MKIQLLYSRQFLKLAYGYYFSFFKIQNQHLKKFFKEVVDIAIAHLSALQSFSASLQISALWTLAHELSLYGCGCKKFLYWASIREAEHSEYSAVGIYDRNKILQNCRGSWRRGTYPAPLMHWCGSTSELARGFVKLFRFSQDIPLYK